MHLLLAHDQLAEEKIGVIAKRHARGVGIAVGGRRGDKAVGRDIADRRVIDAGFGGFADPAAMISADDRQGRCIGSVKIGRGRHGGQIGRALQFAAFQEQEPHIDGETGQDADDQHQHGAHDQGRALLITLPAFYELPVATRHFSSPQKAS